MARKVSKKIEKLFRAVREAYEGCWGGMDSPTVALETAEAYEREQKELDRPAAQGRAAGGDQWQAQAGACAQEWRAEKMQPGGRGHDVGFVRA